MNNKTVSKMLNNSQSYLANAVSFLGEVESEAIMHPLSCPNAESIDDIVLLVSKARQEMYNINKIIRQIGDRLNAKDN